MDVNLGLLGASFIVGIAALGSGMGVGICAQSAIGAWKKCFLTNKAAPMTLLVFMGFPLTNIFYAYILMMSVIDAATANPEKGLFYLGCSIASGVAIALTAIIQGKAAGFSADAVAETGKGFAQFVTIIGIIEPVALFAMVLTMNVL